MAQNYWLLFNGDKMIVNADSRTFFPAVSGRGQPFLVESTNLGRTFDYGLSSQAKKDSGPLPSGQYKIRLCDVRQYEHTKKVYVKSLLAVSIGMSPAGYLKEMNKSWGRTDKSLGRIIPILNKDGGSEYRLGRDSCWIHGSGNGPGSIGCIDMLDKMDAFISTLERIFGTGSKTEIPLVVNYGIKENWDDQTADHANTA